MPSKIKKLLPSLIRTRTDVRYTQPNKNAGLTKVAKPASVAAGTTRLELATSGVIASILWILVYNSHETILVIPTFYSWSSAQCNLILRSFQVDT